MHRRWRVLVTLAATGFFALSAAQAVVVEGTAPAPSSIAGRPLAEVPDVALDEIRRGVRGFGVTEGATGPFRFDVEVVDVIRSGASTPLVLVRTRPNGDDTRFLVAAGMSGSPVYVGPSGEERLAGALAYALAGGDHDLALVVPIAAMRGLGSSAAKVVPPSTWGGMDVVPISVPVVVTGLSSRSANHLRALERRSGVVLVTVGSGPLEARGDGPTPGDGPTHGEDPNGARPTDEPALSPSQLASPSVAPGDAIGFALVRGDVQVAAVGTVTAVDGREAWALGHPLTHAGALPYAWVDARVSTIVSHTDLPYKLASTSSRVVGSTFWDGEAGVYGRLEAEPLDVPLTVTVQGPDRRGWTESRVLVDPSWTPALSAAVVQQTVDDVLDVRSGGTATVRWTLTLVGREPLVVVDHVRDGEDVATRVATSVAAPVRALLANPFEEPGVRSIDVEVTVDRFPSSAQLLEVALEAPTSAPGGTIAAFVKLQPYRAPSVDLTVRFDLPSDTPEGPVRLYLRGGATPSAIDDASPAEWTFDPDRQATSGRPPVLSFDELLAALAARDTGRDLIVETVGPNGERLRLATVPLDHFVLGRAAVTVLVEAEATGDDARPGDDRSGQGGER